MRFNDRKERRLQPHDVQEVQARVLLDVHGLVVGARYELV